MSMQAVAARGPAVRIEPAAGEDDMALVAALFREYQASPGFGPCFQGFDAELAGLPGAYGPPDGALYLARVDGVPAGVAGLRPSAEGDGRTCEMKRLYVRPGHRGLGIGRRLAETVLATATALGYARIVLETLPAMREAAAIYRRLGFRESAGCRAGVAGARCLIRDLA